MPNPSIQQRRRRWGGPRIATLPRLVAALASGACLATLAYLLASGPDIDSTPGLITSSAGSLGQPVTDPSSTGTRHGNIVAESHSQRDQPQQGLDVEDPDEEHQGEAKRNGPTSAADEEGMEAGGASDGGLMVGDDDRAVGAENGGDEGGGEDEHLGVVRPEVMSVQPFTGPAMGGIVLTITGFSLWRRDALEVSVSVGPEPCRSLERLAPGSVECVLPGGVGRSLDVSVTAVFEVAKQNITATSRPNRLFSYEDPRVESVSPAQGRSSGGTRVTLSGVNFGPSSLGVLPQVKFGDAAALRVERYSDTVLTCTSPSHAEGPLSVRVLVGPEDGLVEAVGVIEFVYVLTPAEKLLKVSRGVFDGLLLRLCSIHKDNPVVLNRGSLTTTGGGGEVEFLDVVANTTRGYSVPPHLLDSLPAEDYTNRYKTCAVVGESAKLLNAGKGHEIDHHQAVFRMAHAPLKGFEDHVGKKSTMRVAHPDFLVALGTLETDSHARGQSSFLKHQGAAKSPLFLWDNTAAQDLMANVKAGSSRPSSPLEMLLVAPWLAASVQSLYRKLQERYTTLAAASVALEAAAAVSDEATPEQAAQVLAAYKALRNNSDDGEGSAAEEEEEAEEQLEGETVDDLADAGREEAADQDEGGEEEEEGVEEVYNTQRRKLRSRAASGATQRHQGGTREARVGSSHVPRYPALGPFASVLSDRSLSVEFGAVMLALQLCEGVDLYGFPSFAALQHQAQQETDADGGGQPGEASWLPDLHAYRFDGLYYTGAPEEEVVNALAASGTARMAAELASAPARAEHEEDAATYEDANRQHHQAAQQPPSAVNDDQIQRIRDRHRDEKRQQAVFEAVLWQMMQLSKIVTIKL